MVDAVKKVVLDAGVAAEVATNVVTSAEDLGGGDYAVYGVFVVVLLIVFGLAMRQKSPGKSTTPSRPETGQIPDKSAPARSKTFDVPHVLVGEESGHHVQLVEGATPKQVDKSHDSDAQPAIEDPEPAVEKAGKTLREGLSKTKSGLIGRLSGLFGNRETLDDDLLAELEEVLFTADIGVRTSQKLVEKVESQLAGKSLSDPQKVWGFLKEEVRQILTQDVAPLDFSSGHPFVIMVVGVNGAGKTTTIALPPVHAEGKSVLLAGAIRLELRLWSSCKNGGVGLALRWSAVINRSCECLVRSCERPKPPGHCPQILRRLQAKKGLWMSQKVHRVGRKDGAPHEVGSPDSTNAQNAISQAKEFMNAVQVTGLIYQIGWDAKEVLPSVFETR